MKSSTTANNNRQGREGRRNLRTHEAIINATVALLSEVGYHDLTIEAVAERAGAGKATIYRWWSSKAALAAEAISSTLVIEDPPETGDFRDDIIAAIEISIENYGTSNRVAVPALASTIADDPELLASFREAFIMPRRKVVADLLEHAKAEGALADHVDPELVMDMWAGAVFYRTLFRHAPLDDDFAECLVDATIGPHLL